MFIIDVLINITRRVGELVRELVIHPELPTPPTLEEVDRAVEQVVQQMLSGPDYPRLQAWLAEHEPSINTEILGVFRVR